MSTLGKDHQRILGILSTQGLASSLDLQHAIGKSQPTVSRLLADLSARVLTLGRARATRYGLPKSIHGLPAQQPVWWVGEDGVLTKIGQLSLLAGDLLHVQTDLADSTTAGRLPWFLSPLQAQGFLGRVLAHRLQAHGLGPNPEAWDLESTLFAALRLHDAPGAIVVGEPARDRPHAVPSHPAGLAQALDALAVDVAQTLPAGASAGGEQPKFLATLQDGPHVLVKFTPPRGTPFGERWHDLLQAEALASRVLAGHGVEVARCRVVATSTRSHLVSERFDRIGATGRRHVVSVGAAHAAFVSGSYSNWSATCEALARQRRLAPVGAAQATALLNFGRLIGNSDMHAGNLGLLVGLDGLGPGRFKLAPVYDMLPMRWRPDPVLGGAPDYSPFEPDAAAAAGPARGPAQAFWAQLSQHPDVSAGLREVAAEMAVRLK